MAIINILLIIFGSIATLSVFGGDAWTQTDEAIHKRVTLRGWISLFCLATTLTLGVMKEIQSEKEATEVDAEKRKAVEALSLANEKLREITQKLTETKDELIKTKHELKAGRNESLIATLSLALPIKTTKLQLRMEDANEEYEDIIEYFTKKLPEEYKYLLNIEVGFEPHSGVSERVFFEYKHGQAFVTQASITSKNSQPNMTYPTLLPPKESAFFDPDDYIESFILGRNLPKEGNEAIKFSLAYRELSTKKKIGYFNITLQKTFSTWDESTAFLIAHKHLKLNQTSQRGDSEAITNYFEIPNDIKESINTHWHDTSPMVIVNIHGKSDMILESDINVFSNPESPFEKFGFVFYSSGEVKLSIADETWKSQAALSFYRDRKAGKVSQKRFGKYKPKPKQ